MIDPTCVKFGQYSAALTIFTYLQATKQQKSENMFPNRMHIENCNMVNTMARKVMTGTGLAGRTTRTVGCLVTATFVAH